MDIERTLAAVSSHLGHGEAAAAVSLCLQVLDAEPHNLAAWRLLAAARAALGQFPEAIEALSRVTRALPDDGEAWCNLGVLLSQNGNAPAAAGALARAARLLPAEPVVWFNLGNAHAAAGAAAAAMQAYGTAIALEPGFAAAHANLGDLQRLGGDPSAAVRSYQRALAAGESAASLAGLGAALLDAGRPEAALGPLQRAIELAPDRVDLLTSLGRALLAAGDATTAAAVFDRAVTQAPDRADGWNDLGEAQLRRGELAAALRNFERAASLDSQFAAAESNAGLVELALQRPARAIERFERALELEPGLGAARVARFGARLRIAEWRDYAGECDQVRALIDAPRGLVAPLTLLLVSDDPAEQRRAARRWVQASGLSASPPPPLAASNGHLTIAYLSADFGEHPVGRSVVELLGCHDRRRVRVLGVAFAPSDGTPVRRRIEAACDEFIDGHGLSDGELVAALRARSVAIAIDLGGHTSQDRQRVLASRAAPIQCAYLGYPGTLAAPWIDYLIADARVVPVDERAHYDECLAWLPGSFFPTDRATVPSAPPPDRQAEGLPPDGFVFACFNSVAKISPPVFDVWMALLRDLPGSVLWLQGGADAAARNLGREARARGVDAGRLRFTARLSAEQHLARHALADLFLDTFPYGAHSTGRDALWAGLPVVALEGRGFAARVCSSLLRELGLAELVARDIAEYAAIARALAGDRPRLAALRAQLQRAPAHAPLFDTRRLAASLERAFAEMLARAARGAAPTDLRLDLADAPR